MGGGVVPRDARRSGHRLHRRAGPADLGAALPAWLDQTRPDLWGTLAILDYGPEPFVFEERQRVPLGANMAVRRR